MDSCSRSTESSTTIVTLETRNTSSIQPALVYVSFLYSILRARRSEIGIAAAKVEMHTLPTAKAAGTEVNQDESRKIHDHALPCLAFTFAFAFIFTFAFVFAFTFAFAFA